MVKSLTRRIGAGAWLAAAGFAAACSSGDGAATGLGNASVGTPLQVKLEASSLTAKAGDRIAVAVNATLSGDKPLGAIQGTLKFDPKMLRYVGQPSDKSTIAVVETGKAASGELGLAAINANGLPARAVVLAFEVAGTGYQRGLSFQYVTGGTASARIALVPRAQVAPAVAAAPDLTVPSSVAVLSVADWAKTLGLTAGPSLNPGELGVANLKYGDANLDGSVNVSDALDVVTVSLNGVLIQGTGGALGSGTRKDYVVSANVEPANGGPNGACRPGLANCANPQSGGIDVVDALAIVLESVSPGSQPVAGKVILNRGSLASKARKTLACPITSNLTLSKDTIYTVPKGTGPTDNCVVSGATLTINAGTRIEADSVALVIARDGLINATGTFLEPIEFDCANPTATAANGGPFAAGCWGGLYINGNAPVNSGSACPAGGRASGGICGSGEGNTGFYGGNAPGDNSGVVKYVRILNAGTRFTPTNERNGLTLQGVGNGTTVDFVNIDNGLDDGVEFFGGTVNVKHVLVTRSQDDGFDWVLGYRGKAQFIIVRGCTTGCDRGIEADNNGIDGNGADPENVPRSQPTLFNFTLVGDPSTAASSSQAVLLRQNTGGMLRNFLVFDYKSGLDVDQPDATVAGIVASQGICAAIARDSLTFKNALFAGNGDATGAQVGDRDGSDPVLGTTAAGTVGACGPYDLNGTTNPSGGANNGNATNLEAQWVAFAGGNRDYSTVSGATGATAGIGYPSGTVSYTSNFMTNDAAAGVRAGATTYLIAPYDPIPNWSPKGGTLAATLVGQAPPVDGFFDNVTYYGATAPSTAMPWWTGWTAPTGR